MIKLSQLQKGLPAKNINTESGGIDDHDCQWKVRGVDSCTFVKVIDEKDASCQGLMYDGLNSSQACDCET